MKNERAGPGGTASRTGQGRRADSTMKAGTYITSRQPGIVYTDLIPDESEPHTNLPCCCDLPRYRDLFAGGGCLPAFPGA
jgi:hypothetical protein